MKLINIGFGLICILLLLVLVCGWSCSNDRQTIFAAFIGLFGAIIGAFIGVESSKRINQQSIDAHIAEISQLNADRKMRNTFMITYLLQYTYEILNNTGADVECKGLIYISDWYDKLVDSNFSNSERNDISKWILKIQLIAGGYGYAVAKMKDWGGIEGYLEFNSSQLSSKDVDAFFPSRMRKCIVEIIEKHKKKEAEHER